MAKKPDNKVSELFPGSIAVKMLDGRKAIIPPITVYTFCILEETQEGGLLGFWNKIKANPFGQVLLVSQVLYDMLENKDDFKDVTDFRKNFDIGSVMSVMDSINDLVEKSLPAITAAAGALGKGKKSLGGSLSARSPSTMQATKLKTA